MTPTSPPSAPARAWSALPMTIVGAALTVAFSAGITVSTVNDLKAQTAALSSRVDSREREHERDGEQIRSLQSSQARQDAAVVAMSDTLQKINVNLALVCQATKGAACVR